MPEYTSYLTAEQLIELIAKEPKDYRDQDDAAFQRDALIDMCQDWLITNPNGVPPKQKTKKDKEYVLDVDKKRLQEMYYGATSIKSWFLGYQTARPDNVATLPPGIESLDAIRLALKPLI